MNIPTLVTYDKVGGSLELRHSGGRRILRKVSGSRLFFFLMPSSSVCVKEFSDYPLAHSDNAQKPKKINSEACLDGFSVGVIINQVYRVFSNSKFTSRIDIQNV